MPVYMHSSARFQGAESKSKHSMETCTHIVTSSAERCETDTCHNQGVCIPQSVSRTNAAACAHGHRKCGLTDLHHAGTAVWHGPRRPRCAGHAVTCTQHSTLLARLLAWSTVMAPGNGWIPSKIRSCENVSSCNTPNARALQGTEARATGNAHRGHFGCAGARAWRTSAAALRAARRRRLTCPAPPPRPCRTVRCRPRRRSSATPATRSRCRHSQLKKFVSAQVGEVGGDILKAETVQLQGGPAVTMSTLQRILSTSSRGHHCSKAICSQSTRLCGVRWCAWPGGVCGLAGPARGLMGAVLAAAAFFAALSAHVNAVTLLSRPALPADCMAP